MDKTLKYCLGVIVAFASPSLLALTDAEIEARFDRYESQIQALESRLRSSAPVYEQDLNKQVRKNEKKIKKMNDKIAAENERVRLNGFMTTGVSMGSDPLGTAYNIDDKPSFTGDSKMGLQMNYQLSDRADATIQLVARSRTTGDSWNVAAEWAYIGYKLTDDLKIRVGRLRVPFYMYSETLDVGYSYPWVRPPMEMYNTVFNTYDGADLTYNFNIGSAVNSVQFYTSGTASNTDYDTDVVQDLSIEDMYGINLTSSWSNWTARLMATRIGIDGGAGIKADTLLDAAILTQPAAVILPGLASQGITSCDRAIDGGPLFDRSAWCAPGGYLHTSVSETINYYATGLQYDNGNLFVMSEISVFRGKTGALFSNADSGYITGGYRMGDWTPYATYAHTYDKTGSNQTAMRSNSLGLSHNLSSSLKTKFEWNHFYNIENSGNFNSGVGSSADVYTITLDAIF